MDSCDGLQDLHMQKEATRIKPKLIKLQKNPARNYFCTVPKKLIEGLKWEQGDMLLIEAAGCGILINKAKLPPPPPPDPETEHEPVAWLIKFWQAPNDPEIPEDEEE